MKMKKDAAVNADVNQAAINAMAHEVYVIKLAGKVKAQELAKFEPTVDVDDQPFLDGVPFAFPFETTDGPCQVTGKLKLRNQRVWDVTDIVITK